MKLYHFALIFLLFFLAVVIRNDTNIGKLKSIENEKAELTESLNTASSDTINYLAKTGAYGTNSINKTEVVSIFLTSLYSSMGISSNMVAQKELELYIPVILLCDMDGYYVYYYDECKAKDGLTYTNRKWSEKMPYYYKDDNFIYRFSLSDNVSIYDVNNLINASQKVLEINYHEIQTEGIYKDFRNAHSNSILLNDESFELVKKTAITKQLENVMSYYTSKHNKIAQQNGITYTFSFPANSEGEWAQYMDEVNMLVVFQGYPYGMNHNYTYNKIACAGTNVTRKEVYYVEKKSWFYLAHRAGCPKLKESISVLDETYDSLKECVALGAFCCECIEHGARVPEIK